MMLWADSPEVPDVWTAVRQALYGSLDGVFVPDMYEDLTTQRVLIMEWVEGRRLRTGTSGAPPLPTTHNPSTFGGPPSLPLRWWRPLRSAAIALD